MWKSVLPVSWLILVWVFVTNPFVRIVQKRKSHLRLPVKVPLWCHPCKYFNWRTNLLTNHNAYVSTLMPIIKVLFFMCFIGRERITRDWRNQTFSLASAREGDNALFTGDKQKKSRAPSREHTVFGQPKTANVLWITLCTESNLTFFRN